MGTTKNREDGQVTLWKYGTSINTLGDKGEHLPLYISFFITSIQLLQHKSWVAILNSNLRVKC